jgi:hypothetical protein
MSQNPRRTVSPAARRLGGSFAEAAAFLSKRSARLRLSEGNFFAVHLLRRQGGLRPVVPPYLAQLRPEHPGK